mmetsp:Transcript_11054/g.25974  ORF Transcript_11054/g.25974 Transcript_11054/m.25974 type:complete len:264 (+) Transcript_11054:59-850(+)
MPADSVKLGDGSVMQIARLPEVDESTWDEMKRYLERNPEIARGLKNFSKNPEAMRGWLQTQAVAEHYQAKLQGEGSEAREKLDSLESDPELSYVFDEIKQNGISGAMKYWDNEELLLKISDRMGSMPPELKATLKRVEETPLSMHEAARHGHGKAVIEFLKKGQHVDAHDARDITPLGYALGAGHAATVRLLVESRADTCAVDAAGNTGLHYAAGYGHRELAEYLMSLGAEPHKLNADRQSPSALAALNGHEALVQLLSAHGA